MAKLPPATQAWQALAALAGQGDEDQDIVRGDYVGPLPLRVFAAALLDLRARVAAIEQATKAAKP